MSKRKQAETVKDHMTRSPVTITSADSLQAAMDILVKHNIHELPVVERDELIGIVTERDLRQLAPSYPLFRDEEEIRYFSETMKVASAMSPDPLVVSPGTTLVEAARLLQTYRISSLPVIENGKLVGIISVTDLLKVFIEQYEGQ